MERIRYPSSKVKQWKLRHASHYWGFRLECKWRWRFYWILCYLLEVKLEFFQNILLLTLNIERCSQRKEREEISISWMNRKGKALHKGEFPQSEHSTWHFSVYLFSGSLVINRCEVSECYSFVDFLRGGLQINLMCSIDYTGDRNCFQGLECRGLNSFPFRLQWGS